jgi:MYXO-CTERM domain-containing protein
MLAGGVALVAATAQDARACGGCFIRPTSQVATVVTDHRMVFSISPTQSTLYDQIRYSGSPSDFAWVLPIHGNVGVGVSSDLLFSVLDQNTQTTILAPPSPCRPCRSASGSGGGGFLMGASAGAPTSNGGVTVTAQQVVGPYDTVQLHPNTTTDTMAVTAWLQANSYAIPPSVDPIIAAYVAEGFDFLAIKLVPGQGVQAMRPISVTSTGAALSLPLRMVAAGTGATVGITLWVVATGRYEPQNFSSFTIAASDLVWDWSMSSSNYTTLRAQKEQAFNNTAWQIESSTDIAVYTIESAVLQDPTASAYDAVPAGDGGAGQTALEVRSQDLNTLFPQGGGSARITRMRADLSQAALATDLVLQASADQSALSNTYQATLSVNANCPCGFSGGSSGGTSFGGGAPVSGSTSGSGTAGSTGGTAGSGNSGAGSTGSGVGQSPIGASGNNSGTTGGNTGSNSSMGAAVSGQHSSSGCSAASSGPGQDGLFAGLLGFVGLAFLRTRTRKAR